MREVLIVMRMKPHDYPIQQAEPVNVHVRHFGRPVAYGFVILFQESCIQKGCTKTTPSTFQRRFICKQFVEDLSTFL